MLLKIHKNKKGFTLLELVIVIGIISIIFAGLLKLIKPGEYKARGRDNRRLADVGTLDRMVNEFMLDNGYFPNLGIDYLLDYNPVIPEDPINDATYYYDYDTDGSVYEINASLEYYTEKMTSDGGNQDDRYEVGNDLTVLP